jgi:ABC-2 type transport system ATP-binding protein
MNLFSSSKGKIIAPRRVECCVDKILLSFFLFFYSMIRVKNLRKSYGDSIAVDDLSFCVKSGEVIGFLGPNGAGKTTTMRIMAGYLSPDSGNITINNISTEKDPIAAQKQIGYLPESNPLYKDMLVSDFLHLSADLKAIPKKEKHSAFSFVINATDLDSVFFKPINELSKGYKQRLGLAAALLHKPKVLILDEPTEGLDPIQRNEIRNLIHTLAKKHTIFVSTHVMQEVSAMCNRVIMLKKGSKVADGSIEELTSQAMESQKLTLIVEGIRVASALKEIPGVENVQSEKIDQKRTQYVLTGKKESSLQPEISRLARQYEWIIWRLEEDNRNLENLFQSFTDKQS